MSSAIHIHAANRFSRHGDEPSKWVDSVLGQSFQTFAPGRGWQPSVNVCEDDDAYFIVVDLAGVSIADIHLSLENDVLLLTGTRKAALPPDCRPHPRLHVMEIDHGDFERALKIPPDADADEITAHYKGGFLAIQIPKRR